MKMDKLALVIATGLVLATGGFWTPANAAEAEKGKADKAVRPSNLIFLPEAEEMTGGGSIEIKFTAKTGKVQLWIDDKKIGEADSPAAFKWKLPSRKKAYKVEIKKAGKVLVGRYIPKKHPYFFFRDVKKTAAYRHRDKTPYKGWISSLGRRGVVGAAMLYQLTGQASYKETVRKALFDFPLPPEKPEWKGYGSYANFGYGLNKNYAIAYDMIASSLTPEERSRIEDRLIQSAQRMAEWTKQSLRYDIGGHIVLGSNLAATACSVLGYHGRHQDQGNPYKLLDDAITYVLVSSPGAKFYESTSKGLSAMKLSCNSDGHQTEGGYRAHYSTHIAPFPVICMNSIGRNLAEEHHILHGHFLDIVGITCPDGRYPNIVSSLGSTWWDLLSAPPLYAGEQQKAVQWYCNHLWEWKKLTGMGHRVRPSHITWGFTYDKDAPAAPPTFDGDPCYFSYESGSAVFRSGWDKDDLYLYFKADHEGGGGGGHYTPHQLSYDVWAKGAYLAIDSGNPRWIVMKTLGHNTFEIDNGTISKGGRQFTHNKSYLENYFATPFLDYGEGRMKVTRTSRLPYKQNPTTPKPLSQPVSIRRAILFPGNEYFVVLDRLESRGAHDYRMLLHLGGSEIAAGKEMEDWAGHGQQIAADNMIKGKLKINGEKVPWGGKEYRTRKKRGRFWEQPNPMPVEHKFDSAQNVSWTTGSVTPAHPKSFDVELKVFITPKCSVEQRLNVAHLGDYSGRFDFWHPVLNFKQKGANVKYISILYPRRAAGDPDPKIEELKVAGGSDGNDYAVKLSREGVRDIVTISDGEKITAEKITTDAKISYCRTEKDVLTILMLAGGRTFSFNGKILASSTNRLRNLALKFEKGKIIGHAEAEKPTKVDLYCSFKPGKIIWKPDRPVWVSPSTDPGICKPVEIPFRYKANRISLELPQGKGRITVE